ncbi:hypothetical protein Clacol_010316 [Clathrus columnatus]|uniref:Uncharacterized protein n=1 Tax=Clathrus columnatus TaxID=1419009 RepID=A0AAV5AMY0_9AGAM|nr:hypothetical protein Clacol_010316 [Clathrus columnatus]
MNNGTISSLANQIAELTYQEQNSTIDRNKNNYPLSHLAAHYPVTQYMVIMTASDYILTVKSVIAFNLIHNIALILFETLAFIGLIRQIWGLWKSKKSLDLQDYKDISTLLLRQAEKKDNM